MTPIVAARESAAMWRKMGNYQMEGRWRLYVERLEKGKAANPPSAWQRSDMPKKMTQIMSRSKATQDRILPLITSQMTTAQVAVLAKMSLDAVKPHLRTMAEAGRIVRVMVKNRASWGPIDG